MKQLTSNVYIKDGHSLYDGYRGCNYGFVTTRDGLVMIDTPMIPTDAIAWRNKLTAYGEVRYLINTHYHIDHITGDYFFPGTTIAHDYTRTRFTAPVEATSPDAHGTTQPAEDTDPLEYIKSVTTTIDPHAAPLFADYALIEPEISFSDSLTLTVGDHTFELVHTPGHTPGDIGIRIPREGVYFSGDTIANKEFPALSSSNPSDWVSSLTAIESLEFDHLVPGHGPASDPELAGEFRAFLEDCIARVRTAIEAGKSKEEAVSEIDFTANKPPLHPEPDRQRRNVEHLYEALS